MATRVVTVSGVAADVITHSRLGAYETPIDKMLSLPPQRGRLETRAG